MPGSEIPNTNPLYWDQGGWKIHLVPNAGMVTGIIQNWLEQNCRAHWKYLNGGEPGQSDFTVYLGSHDEMQRAALVLEKNLDAWLRPVPVDNTTDMRVGRFLGARFDTKGTRAGAIRTAPKTSCRFYGWGGLPMADSHMDLFALGNPSATRQFALAATYRLLSNSLGDYFHGGGKFKEPKLPELA